MPKYIDAELLPSLFDEEYKGTVKLIEQGETHLNNIAEGFLEAHQVILKIPPADVRENVYGEWKWDKREGVYLCPFCKEEMHDAIRRDGSYSLAEFCWHCGADMKKEDWGDV